LIIKFLFLFLAYTKTQKMKKVLLAMVAVAFFASCKKDYTCTCVDTSGIEPILPTTVDNFDGLSKTDADVQQAACTIGNSVSFYTCTWAEK